MTMVYGLRLVDELRALIAQHAPLSDPARSAVIFHDNCEDISLWWIETLADASERRHQLVLSRRDIGGRFAVYARHFPARWDDPVC